MKARIPGIPQKSTMGVPLGNRTDSGGMPKPVNPGSGNPGSGEYKTYLDAANTQWRDPVKDARELGGIARQQFELQLNELAKYQQKGANVAGYQQRQTQAQQLKGQSWDNYINNSNAANQTIMAANQAQKDSSPMGKTFSVSGGGGGKNAPHSEYKQRAHEVRMAKLAQSHEANMAHRAMVNSSQQNAAQRAHDFKMGSQQLDLERNKLRSTERMSDKQLQSDMYKNYMQSMQSSFDGGGGSYGGYW
jgi:hypothetical protein